MNHILLTYQTYSFLRKIIFFLVIVCLISSCKKKTIKIDFSNQVLAVQTFECKPEINAGEDLIIQLPSVIKYDVGAYFIITHPMGSAIEKVSGLSTNLKNKYTKKSGLVWIQMIHNSIVYDEKKINIIPGKGIGNMASYIGPKSILTTTAEPCMVIGIPEDVHNNPVATGTNVDYSFLRPNLRYMQEDIKTEYLLSHYTFNAYMTMGKTLVGIQCDSSYSEEKYVDEEPGWAYKMKLNKVNKNLRADGKQYLTISTDIIRDKLGNKVMDGTIVTFIITGEDNSKNQYTSVTVDGIAKIKFQHPTYTKKYKTVAISGNARSNAIPLHFTSDVNPFSVRMIQDKEIISIGPITSYLNQFIPDGSEINFIIFKDKKEIKKGIVISQKGKAILELEELMLSSGKYTFNFEYSGIKKSIEINI